MSEVLNLTGNRRIFIESLWRNRDSYSRVHGERHDTYIKEREDGGKENAPYLYSRNDRPDMVGCSHCVRGIRKSSHDGALSGIGRCLPVFRIYGMEKREGRQRREIIWEKRS